MSLLDFLKQDAPAASAEAVAEPVVAEAPAKPVPGRQQLLRHVAWINQNLNDADPIERAQATLHAFSENFDGLDPETDEELIRAGRNLFRAVNPELWTRK